MSYSRDVSRIENYWICGELIYFMYEFFKVILNKNRMFTITIEAFECYGLRFLSYAPVKFTLPVLKFIANKTTNVYDIDISLKNRGGIQFNVKRINTYNYNKMDCYNKSVYFNVHEIVHAGFTKIVQHMYNLPHIPELVEQTEIDEGPAISFVLKFKKGRIKVSPSLLLICNTVLITLFSLNALFGAGFTFYIIFLFVFFNLNFIYLNVIKRERENKKLLEDHMIKLNQESYAKMNELEKLSSELIEEKELLEKKVKERTKKLYYFNKKLKKIDKLKTNFFGNMSHELKTPLSLIKVHLESIINRNYGKTVDHNNDIFQVMYRNCNRLYRLISTLLDYHKIKNGKLTVNKCQMNIIPAVKGLMNEFAFIAVSKNITMRLHTGIDDGFIVLMDRNLFESIFFNLLSNALKFTANNGRIDIFVKTRNENNILELTVTDSGIGISEDELSSIFHKYKQIKTYPQNDCIETDHNEGTGIGLAFVKEIVKYLGGNIKVESVLSEGTTFTVSIPITGDTSTLPLEKKIRQTDVDNKRVHNMSHVNMNPQIQESKTCYGIERRSVLIVEDNVDLLHYLKTILEKEYNVVECDNVIEALDKINSLNYNIDLIISDILLPYIDGIKFKHKLLLNEHCRNIPFIFLTAKASLEDEIRGLEAGAIDYIKKPFSAKKLLAKVNSIITNRQETLQGVSRKIKKHIDREIFNIKAEVNIKDIIAKNCVKYRMTAREKCIINYILEGYQDKEISEMLNISTRTVSNYLYKIYEKFNINNRVELIKHLLQ